MVMTVTPQKALEWIEKNTSNRPLSHARIRQYVKDITDGNFGLTGEAIRFFEDGTLADGQHRLTAIVKACKSIETLVVFGLSKSVASYIDTGKSRTAGDVLCMFSGVGDADAKALATTIRMIVHHDAGRHYAATSGSGNGNTSTAMTNREIQDFYRDNEEALSDAMDWVRAHGKFTNAVIPRAAQTALYYLFKRANAPLAHDYLSKIIHGMNVEPKSTQASVREILLRDLSSTRKLDLRSKIYTVVKGFNSEHKRRGISSAKGALWTISANGETPLPVTDSHK
jgi:hypothetical protein